MANLSQFFSTGGGGETKPDLQRPIRVEKLNEYSIFSGFDTQPRRMEIIPVDYNNRFIVIAQKNSNNDVEARGFEIDDEGVLNALTPWTSSFTGGYDDNSGAPVSDGKGRAYVIRADLGSIYELDFTSGSSISTSQTPAQNAFQGINTIGDGIVTAFDDNGEIETFKDGISKLQPFQFSLSSFYGQVALQDVLIIVIKDTSGNTDFIAASFDQGEDAANNSGTNQEHSMLTSTFSRSENYSESYVYPTSNNSFSFIGGSSNTNIQESLDFILSGDGKRPFVSNVKQSPNDLQLEVGGFYPDDTTNKSFMSYYHSKGDRVLIAGPGGLSPAPGLPVSGEQSHVMAILGSNKFVVSGAVTYDSAPDDIRLAVGRVENI